MDALTPSGNDSVQCNGVNIANLAVGTKLHVETDHSFYDIVIVDGKHITVFGGITADEGIRYGRPTPAIFCGSTWAGAMMKVDWIGREMSMEFIEEDSGKLYSTSRVQNVTIESADGEWYYSMDWKTKKPK